LALCLTTACVSSVPRQPMPAAPPPPASVVVTPAPPTVWPITPSVLTREFSVDQRAALTTTTDSGTFSDSTSVVVELSFRRTADGGAAGLIRSVAVGAPGVPALPVPGIAASLAFTVPPTSRGGLAAPTVRGPRTDPCRSPADIPLAVVRDLAVRVPDTLRLATSWSDSGSFDTCRDGAIMTVTLRRTFRVRQFVPDTAGGVLVVDRSSRTTVRGAAIRGDDTTHIEGAGTGTMAIRLDARSGSLVNAEGTSDLELVIRGRTKTERARQASRARVSLVPPRSR
jgi:hypothetical protein